jgi:glycosyltransferase involved in cell wall biosynthesis
MAEGQRIRVVQFLNSTVRSGAEEVALELARGLDPKRFRSFLVCPPELMKAFGDDCHAGDIETLGLSLQSPWQAAVALRFVGYLRSQKIDVVNAHMIRAAVVAVPLARMAGVPIVIQTCHGREAWRKGWLKRRYWIDRIIARWADATVAVSEATRTYLVKEKRLGSHKVKVIRNGRSLGGFSPSTSRQESLRSELSIGPKDPLVGVFGRLEEQKGHRFLLSGMPSILAQLPATKVILVGEGALRHELESYASSLNVAEAVRFAGYRPDWKELMALSDIIVLPSLYEGMPLVPIEAAAMARPVVATSVDGTSEVIIDEVTGLLVPPGESEPLAQAIVDLLTNPAKCRRLGQSAQARAHEQFSLQRQIEETAGLYEQLLSRTERLLRPTTLA